MACQWMMSSSVDGQLWRSCWELCYDEAGCYESWDWCGLESSTTCNALNHPDISDVVWKKCAHWCQLQRFESKMHLKLYIFACVTQDCVNTAECHRTAASGCAGFVPIVFIGWSVATQIWERFTLNGQLATWHDLQFKIFVFVSLHLFWIADKDKLM